MLFNIFTSNRIDICWAFDFFIISIFVIQISRFVRYMTHVMHISQRYYMRDVNYREMNTFRRKSIHRKALEKLIENKKAADLRSDISDPKPPAHPSQNPSQYIFCPGDPHQGRNCSRNKTIDLINFFCYK